MSTGLRSTYGGPVLKSSYDVEELRAANEKARLDGMGLRNARASVYDLAGSVSAGLGQVLEPVAPNAAQYWFDEAENSRQQSQRFGAAKTFKESESFGDYVESAGDYLARNAASLTAQVGAGAAGGAYATARGLGAAGQMISSMVGTSVPTFPMELGNQTMRLRDDPTVMENTTPGERLQNAATYSAISTPMQVVAPSLLGGRLIGATNELAKGGFKEAGKHLAKTVPEALLTESLPEVGAALLGQHMHGQLNPNRDTSRDKDELVESAWGGFAAGGAMSGAGRTVQVARTNVPLVKDAVNTQIDRFKNLLKPDQLPPDSANMSDEAILEWDRQNTAKRDAEAIAAAENLMQDPSAPDTLKAKAADVLRKAQEGVQGVWEELSAALKTERGAEQRAQAATSFTENVPPKPNSEWTEDDALIYEDFKNYLPNDFPERGNPQQLFSSILTMLESDTAVEPTTMALLADTLGSENRAVAALESVHNMLVRTGRLEESPDFRSNLESLLKEGVGSRNAQADVVMKNIGLAYDVDEATARATAQDITRALERYDSFTPDQRKSFDDSMVEMFGKNSEKVLEALAPKSQSDQMYTEEEFYGDDGTLIDGEASREMQSFEEFDAKTQFVGQATQRARASDGDDHGGFWQLGHVKPETRESIRGKMDAEIDRLVAEGNSVRLLTPTEYAQAAGVSLKAVAKELGTTVDQLEGHPARMIRSEALGDSEAGPSFTTEGIRSMARATKAARQRITPEEAKTIRGLLAPGSGKEGRRQLAAMGFANVTDVIDGGSNGFFAESRTDSDSAGSFKVTMADGAEITLSAQDIIRQSRRQTTTNVKSKRGIGDADVGRMFAQGISSLISNPDVVGIKLIDMYGNKKENPNLGPTQRKVRPTRKPKLEIPDDATPAQRAELEANRSKAEAVNQELLGTFGPFFPLMRVGDRTITLNDALYAERSLKGKADFASEKQFEAARTDMEAALKDTEDQSGWRNFLDTTDKDTLEALAEEKFDEASELHKQSDALSEKAEEEGLSYSEVFALEREAHELYKKAEAAEIAAQELDQAAAREQDRAVTTDEIREKNEQRERTSPKPREFQEETDERLGQGAKPPVETVAQLQKRLKEVEAKLSALTPAQKNSDEAAALKNERSEIARKLGITTTAAKGVGQKNYSKAMKDVAARIRQVQSLTPSGFKKTIRAAMQLINRAALAAKQGNLKLRDELTQRAKNYIESLGKEPTAIQRNMVKKAAAELGPEFAAWMGDLKGIWVSPRLKSPGLYNSANDIMAIHPNTFNDPVLLKRVIAHEMGHRIDYDRENHTMRSYKGFDTSEIEAFVKANPDMKVTAWLERDHLQDKVPNKHVRIRELFARASEVYWLHPAVLKRHMPNTFAYLKAESDRVNGLVSNTETVVLKDVENPVVLPKKTTYTAKDQKKANKATKFIGRGSPESSTAAYAEAFGDKANSGEYSTTDVVFVSAEGNRKGRVPFDKGELKKAMDAGATIVTDGKTTGRQRDYNVGEREVAVFLEQNGYREAGDGVWVPAKTKENASGRPDSRGTGGRGPVRQAVPVEPAGKPVRPVRNARTDEGSTGDRGDSTGPVAAGRVLSKGFIAAAKKLIDAGKKTKDGRPTMLAKLPAALVRDIEHNKFGPKKNPVPYTYHVPQLFVDGAKPIPDGYNELADFLFGKGNWEWRQRNYTNPMTEMMETDGSYLVVLKGKSKGSLDKFKELHDMVSEAEAPKAEAPKAEAPKAEAPKAEAPKAEAPKAEAPKAEAPKAEAPKAEAPKAEAPKAEAPKTETPADPFAELEAMLREDSDPGANHISREEAQSVLDYIKKVLGPEVMVEFVRSLGGKGSAQWARENGKAIISMVITSTDPLSKAHHEAMHEFFQRLLDGHPEIAETLLRAANSAPVQSQIARFFKDTPGREAILESMKNDPAERVAYMFQVWAAGKMNLGPKTQTTFEKIAHFIRKALGRLTDYEKTDLILAAFHGGRVAEVSKIGEVLNKDLNARAEYVKKITDAWEKYGGVVRELGFSAQGRFERSENPAVRKLGTMFFNAAKDEGTGLGYHSAKVRASNILLNSLINKVFKGLDRLEMAELLEIMQRGEEAPAGKLAEAQKAMKKFMEDIHTYMTAAGVEMGKVKDYQIPRVWDHMLIADDRKGFVEMLMADAKKAGVPLDRIEAMAIAQTLIANRGAEPVGEGGWHVGYTPFMASVNERKLKFIQNADFAKYQQKDLVGIMSNYISQSVHRAEYTRRFGDKGEKMQQMLNEAWAHEVGAEAWQAAMTAAWQQDGSKERDPRSVRPDDIARHLTPEAKARFKEAQPRMNEIYRAVLANEGTIGVNDSADYKVMYAVGPATWESASKAAKLAAGPKKDITLQDIVDQLSPLSKKTAQDALRKYERTMKIKDAARKFTPPLIVYQNVRLLSMTLFAQFSDPLGVIMRGGDVKQAYKTYVRGMANIMHGWKGTVAEDSMTQLALKLGIIDASGVVNTMGNAYASVQMGAKTKAVNDALFRINGVEAYTQGTRVGAMEAAISFIKFHAGKGDQHSVRYMKELGLSKSDTDILLADGELNYNNQKVREAIFRWTDDAIIRPNAALRPTWASDPHYALFFHMKQFTYAFHKVILERMVRELDHGNYNPLVALLAGYVPVMIAADTMRAVLANGGEEPYWLRKMDTGDKIAHGVQRSGALGIPQFGVDGLSHGPLELFGPTVEQAAKVAQNLYEGREKLAVKDLIPRPFHNLLDGKHSF